jgi:allantoinase
MKDIVVRGARVVLPDGVRAASIHVRGGRILTVGTYGDTPAAVSRVDAGELMVLPGLVDTHVHMNDPGRADWEGADHATRAAAAGGVTTVIDMPLNSIPSTVNAAALAAKRDALKGRCHVDVGCWGGVVPGNAGDLSALARAGVLGFKCFLSPSGVDEFAHVTERDLREALPEIARLGVPLLAHAELSEKLADPRGSDPRSYRSWLASRPPAAETGAIDLLIALAGEYGARVHIVHLATGDAVPTISDARTRGLPVTVETCPHYLTFAAEEIADGATAFKCAPPIRERQHRERLWDALVSGDIDLVASDHSPSPAADKCLADGDFLRAWGGIASLQLSLAAVWTGAAARRIPIERVVQWMASRPATLAGLAKTKGTISPNADADLVIWDPDVETVVDAAALHHRHPVTPYAGMSLRGRVKTTMLRGQVVFDEGTVLPHPAGRMIGSAP